VAVFARLSNSPRSEPRYADDNQSPECAQGEAPSKNQKHIKYLTCDFCVNDYKMALMNRSCLTSTGQHRRRQSVKGSSPNPALRRLQRVEPDWRNHALSIDTMAPSVRGVLDLAPLSPAHRTPRVMSRLVCLMPSGSHRREEPTASGRPAVVLAQLCGRTARVVGRAGAGALPASSDACCVRGWRHAPFITRWQIMCARGPRLEQADTGSCLAANARALARPTPLLAWRWPLVEVASSLSNIIGAPASGHRGPTRGRPRHVSLWVCCVIDWLR
jgi:hypothetical protein